MSATRIIALGAFALLTASIVLTAASVHAADPTPSPAAAPTPSATTQPAQPAPTTQPAQPAPQPTTSKPDAASTQPAKKRVYVDEDYDFRIPAPEGWTRGSTSGVTVAGNLCRVWGADPESGILVFRSPSIESQTPLQIADATTEAMQTRAQAEVYEQAVTTIGGKKAAVMLFVGRGTSSGVTGQGNVRVAQYMVVIPRVDDMLVVMLITPEELLETHRADFENMLEGMKVGGAQTEAQKRDA